jgi:hypothetical protein
MNLIRTLEAEAVLVVKPFTRIDSLMLMLLVHTFHGDA